MHSTDFRIIFDQSLIKLNIYYSTQHARNFMYINYCSQNYENDTYIRVVIGNILKSIWITTFAFQLMLFSFLNVEIFLTRPFVHFQSELIGSLKLGNVWVFVQLIFVLVGLWISWTKPRKLTNLRLPINCNSVYNAKIVCMGWGGGVFCMFRRVVRSIGKI